VADSATFSSPEAGDDDTGKDLSGLDDMKASQRPDEAPKPKQGRNPKGDGKGKEHKISNVATPINALKLLKDAIEKEAGLEPKLRCHKYRQATLDYFLTCKKTTEDHDLWRECFMHEEMLAILNRRFNALNPHKKGEAGYKSANKEVAKKAVESANADSKYIMTDREFQILYRYTQEIDEDGRRQEEIDKMTITKFPNPSRLELELQAAENYIAIKWGILRKPSSEKETEESKSKKPITNPNPVLNWSELLKELETPNISANTISRAVGRGISKGQKKGFLPWAIGGCAAEYQIVDDQLRDHKGLPTPSSCKYQKIAID
jgi:hypothetical protein